ITPATNPGVVLNPATGEVTVAPGTPAATYTIVYQICEQLNPTNCDPATVTVIVGAATIVATPDAGTVPDGGVGGIAVPDVLVNDTLNGAPATLATVVITQISTTNPGVNLDPATGIVTVSPGTPGGVFTIVYQICEILNPTNCTTTTVTVTVTLGDIAPVAVDDTFTGTESTPIPGNVSTNDTPGNLGSTYTLVPGTGPANGSLVFNPDGSFTYTPNPGFVGTDTFDYQVCDADGDCDTATVTLTSTPVPNKLRIQKAVGPTQVSAGMLVNYTLTVTNIGAVPVIGAQVVDTPPAGFNFVAGSVVIVDTDNAGSASGTGPITFSGIDIPVGGTATIRYLLRVSAGLPAGEYVNKATVFQGGVAVSNTAAATVTATSGSDPDTEQARILGKVFDDQDGDGWQDEGERGIPGVRLATVEGLVTETDSQGRYHIEGLTLSNQMRGQNFVVKVDAATLPQGSVFTTENPLLRRVTPGLPVRFDFGVKLPQRPKQAPSEPTQTVVEAQTLSLGQVMFDTDRDTVKPEFAETIDRIVQTIEAAKGGVIRITGYADLRGSDEYNQALSLRRARAVYAQVAAKLSPEARAGLQVEVEGASDVPGVQK
ncbi:Ig-like domain-containing protein, partial [Arenimonas oryziterrae]